MSNADRIREMSNEELADFLCEVKGDYGQYISVFPDENNHGEWTEWLRQEVDE